MQYIYTINIKIIKATVKTSKTLLKLRERNVLEQNCPKKNIYVQ